MRVWGVKLRVEGEESRDTGLRSGVQAAWFGGDIAAEAYGL